MSVMLTHALFDNDTFMGEVLPNELNEYPEEDLVLLPEDYWNQTYVWEGRTPVVSLTTSKASAVERVNNEAEAFRMRFLTPGSGQAATYLRKESEARAWTTGDDPNTVPFLACEATHTQTSIDDLATLVINQADAWITMGSQIEGLRRGAIVAIDAATSKEEIETAVNIDWESLL